MRDRSACAREAGGGYKTTRRATARLEKQVRVLMIMIWRHYDVSCCALRNKVVHGLMMMMAHLAS